MPHLFIQDLRFGWRGLISNPRFSVVAILTLALGIAVNTTVFTWIEGLLLNPFPGVKNASKLVALETLTPSGEFVNTSYRDYRDYRDNLTLVSGVAAALMNAFTVGGDERPEKVWGEYVSANYFALLEVDPALGRLFSPDDYGDQPGASPVAVISDRLWRQMFHSDPGIVGHVIRLNRHELKIAAVTRAEFRGTVSGLTLDVWVPIVMAPQLNGQGNWLLNDRGSRHVWILGRPKPGVTPAQAQAEVVATARRIAEGEPRTNAGFSAALNPVWRAHSGAQRILLRPLQVLMAGCIVVFLIVAANVANLQLARAATRRKEFSIRLAFGCGAGGLTGQLLTESLLVAVGGGLLAVPAALWMVDALRWLLPPVDLPVVLNPQLSARVLAFTALLTVAGALLAGIAPALHAIRANLSDNLKESARGTTSGGGHARTRGLLVISEVALALIALVGTGLFVRSFENARAISPGMDVQNVLVAQFHVATFCRTPEQRSQFCIRLHERLKGMPGITSIAYSNAIPLDVGPSPLWRVEVEAYSPGPGEDLRVSGAVVSPEFFDALRIPLFEGRAFTERDDREAPPVMIVNQAFARRFFDGRNPVGRKVRVSGRWFKVVGMTRDGKYNTVIEAPRPFFYMPYRQMQGSEFWIAFFIRTAGSPYDAIAAVRREAADVDSNAGVAKIVPMDEVMGLAIYQQKVAAILLTVLGVVSVLLAAVGLYSVMSYTVSRRTLEFGVRMALGAQTRDVLRMVVRQGIGMTAVGLIAGGVAAVVASRFVASLLVNVKPADPMIFAASALFLAAVAIAASYLPARRATKVDPLVALRNE